MAVGSVAPVSVSAADLQALLVSAMSQKLEQSTRLALLNLEIAAGSPDGVGEAIDVVA